MQHIEVGLGERGYRIAIGGGLLGVAGERLAPYCPGGRAIIVTDENVAAHWLAPLADALDNAGIEAAPIILPPGESSKCWAQLEELVETLLDLNIARDEHVIALGGGVVGDLAGFAAAIAKRGCGLVQIPTSLLAQVDSSVGGKTAINSRTSKNMIGAFHQPALVLIDPDTLATLPDRELRAGYAETVKYGLIGDAGFFAWCEENADQLLARDAAALEQAIAACLAAKAGIVAADERDRTGRRALLNLGHSFAHAIEAESDYALHHGEAVAIGIALAFRFSARRGLCGGADAKRVSRHLDAVGLPTMLPKRTDGARLVSHMKQDKKSAGGALTLILARGIGEAFVAPDIDPDDVVDFLAAQLSGTGRE